MELCRSENCTGCTACASICAVDAIQMRSDVEGFSYPEVDYAKCINCGRCVEVCNIINDIDIKNQTLPLKQYGIKILDENKRIRSRSGGAFIAIADWIFSKGGVVYGAGFDKNLKVCHLRIDNQEEIYLLQGSKYVQSDLSSSFKNVKSDLKEGKWVLFSGTPCQVGGIQEFLKKENISREHFVSAEVLCLGVPSPAIYKDYLLFMEQIHKNSIKCFNFRDKEKGWNQHFESLIFNNGKKIYEQFYMRLFYSGYILRPSCYNCKYAKRSRVADFTLADFWGSEEFNKGWDDNKGVSLVLINNEKANIVFEKIKNEIEFFEVIGELSQEKLPALYAPESLKISGRQKFWSMYANASFEKILISYAGYLKPLRKLLHEIKVFVKKYAL